MSGKVRIAGLPNTYEKECVAAELSVSRGRPQSSCYTFSDVAQSVRWPIRNVKCAGLLWAETAVAIEVAFTSDGVDIYRGLF